MTYIHINDERITDYIEKNIRNKSDLSSVAEDLLIWFDRNVEYSRLNAPFFPLQRSDFDVLSMKAGTCGDFSNLIVSVLITLGFEAKYAYVHKDCYGDVQDHICAAVLDADEWILIDATQPYRKWHGFKCPHKEYELLSSEAFEKKFKKEEAYWIDAANRLGNELYAGLLYAPWIRERIIKETDSIIESVFYLLLLDGQKKLTLNAYYRRYSREGGTIPMMSILTGGNQSYCFSCKKPDSIWDNAQWSEKYQEEDIPREFQTKELSDFMKNISEDLPEIEQTVLFVSALFQRNEQQMTIVSVDNSNIIEAAVIHSTAWKESHRSFCSPEFIEKHNPERQREYLQNKLNNGSLIYMLIDGEPVGIVTVTCSLIEDLYVLPDKQNKGYGTALLNFAVKRCSSAPTLWLLENNINAARLYRRAGFKETGRINTSGKIKEIEFSLNNPMKV